MTREEINKVFDFVNLELNSLNDFYFKINSSGNIDAYFVNQKGKLEIFAQFYTTRILNYLKKNEVKDER